MTNENGEVCCQKYKSTQIDANKKGLNKCTKMYTKIKKCVILYKKVKGGK